jgi:multidrug efflux pump subunit AcrB
MSVVIAVLVSTFASLTLVPLITSRFSKLGNVSDTSFWGSIIKRFEKMMDKFVEAISGALLWSLRHKIKTLALAFIAFLGSVALLGTGFVGSEFVNAGDMGEGILTVEYPKNYSLKQNNLVTKKIEQYISEKPEVTGIFTSVGSASGIIVSQGSSYKTEINIKFVDKRYREKSANILMKELENELNSSFPDVKVRSSIVTLIGGADENPIQIVFQSTNTDTLYAFAEKMSREIAKIPGTNNVKLSIEGGSPELVIRTDKDKMARLGLSPQQVGSTIQTAFNGNTDSKFQQGDFEYDINVRLDEFNRRSFDDVEDLTFVNQIGHQVKLVQFADIREGQGKPKLERYGRVSSITLESQALGRPVGDVGNDIISLLESTNMPAGLSYQLEGDLKFQADAFGSLGTAIIISIVLVYLIMVALYQSYLHPFVVLFTIPLSIIGALLALALSQQALSIFSMLGMIMLIGLVTKNAILVVDFINTLRNDGYRLLRAIVTAVNLRIRPILMTAISTVVGMLPIALSQGAGSEWKNGLGWVLIGGMSSAMLLSLIVVPVIYLIVEKMKERIVKWKKKSNEKVLSGAT